MHSCRVLGTVLLAWLPNMPAKDSASVSKWMVLNDAVGMVGLFWK